MVVLLPRGQKLLTIIPDNIINIVKDDKSTVAHPYTIYMNSGDYFCVNERELDLIKEALKLRDDQLDTLIKKSEIIINELQALNSEADGIHYDTTEIRKSSSDISSNTRSIDSNTSTIKSHTESMKSTLNTIKGHTALINNIKDYCANISSYVHSILNRIWHYQCVNAQLGSV